MSVADGLAPAIKEWVDLFEGWPDGGSDLIRLSADSLVVHRVKEFGPEWLWYVTCDILDGTDTWAWSGVAFEIGDGQWSVEGIAGGGGHLMLRGFPWLNLGCQLLPDGFRAGGWVEDPRQQVSEVRMVDQNGIELHDQVKGQVALFRSEIPIKLPLTIDLLDASGASAATHQVP